MEAPAARPATRTDTVLLEGMPEPVELRLVRSPPAFPAAFSTYAPEGFEVDAGLRRDDAPVMRFVAAFGGERDERAYLEIAPYPDGLDEAGATERAGRVAGSGDPEPLGELPFGWVVRGWRWRALDEDGAPVSARLLLGRRDGGFFHALSAYPPEYGDGFGPRARIVLEELRWEG